MGSPAWDDERLAVESDDAWTRQYRALQSWYRERVLRVAAGTVVAAEGRDGRKPPKRKPRAEPVGSMLAAEDVAADPTLNFLGERDVARYVDERVPQVLAAGGKIEEQRLRRNMLSSMPLCFNLFGYLRGRKADAARVLAHLLQLPIQSIDDVVLEWAPAPREAYLDDHTAFDAAVFYRTPRGERGFLGIETKYTEPFSVAEYLRDTYERLTTAPVFRDGAIGRLKGSATNQLWRNVLLALSLREREGFALGHAVVVACRQDPKARCALDGVRAELTAPDDVLRWLPLEELVDAFARVPSTADWAARFTRRYLDLAPVMGVEGRRPRGR